MRDWLLGAFSVLLLAYWGCVWGWPWALFWVEVWAFSAWLGRSDWPRRRRR